MRLAIRYVIIVGRKIHWEVIAGSLLNRELCKRFRKPSQLEKYYKISLQEETSNQARQNFRDTREGCRVLTSLLILSD